MKEIDFGEIRIKLDEIRKAQDISINKLACRAEMQRSQVRSYCNNSAQRLDTAVLARLCYALDCSVADLIEYIPPKNQAEHIEFITPKEEKEITWQSPER